MDRCKQQCGKNTQRSYNRGSYRHQMSRNNQYGCGMNSNSNDDADLVLKCKCDCMVEQVSDYETNKGCCDCEEECPGSAPDYLSGCPLAMAYVPWQRYENLFDECDALYHGTLFKDLLLGFYGMRCE